MYLSNTSNQNVISVQKDIIINITLDKINYINYLNYFILD